MPRLSQKEMDEIEDDEVDVDDETFLKFRERKIREAKSAEEVAEIARRYPLPESGGAREAKDEGADTDAGTPDPDYSDEADEAIEAAFEESDAAGEAETWRRGRMSKKPKSLVEAEHEEARKSLASDDEAEGTDDEKDDSEDKPAASREQVMKTYHREIGKAQTSKEVMAAIDKRDEGLKKLGLTIEDI